MRHQYRFFGQQVASLPGYDPRGNLASTCIPSVAKSNHAAITWKAKTWRDAGVVDRAGLENRCGRKATEGSNPSLSACVSLQFATRFE